MVYCWAGFLITSGVGIGMFVMPELNAELVLLPVPEAGLNPYFIRMLAAILVPLGLCYLFALLDPDASRSLMIIVTSEKFLAVLYSLFAFMYGRVGPLIWLVILGDGVLGLIGLYASIQLYRNVETMDQMDEDDNGEESDSAE